MSSGSKPTPKSVQNAKKTIVHQSIACISLVHRVRPSGAGFVGEIGLNMALRQVVTIRAMCLSRV